MSWWRKISPKFCFWSQLSHTSVIAAHNFAIYSSRLLASFFANCIRFFSDSPSCVSKLCSTLLNFSGIARYDYLCKEQIEWETFTLNGFLLTEISVELIYNFSSCTASELAINDTVCKHSIRIKIDFVMRKHLENHKVIRLSL